MRSVHTLTIVGRPWQVCLSGSRKPGARSSWPAPRCWLFFVDTRPGKPVFHGTWLGTRTTRICSGMLQTARAARAVDRGVGDRANGRPAWRTRPRVWDRRSAPSPSRFKSGPPLLSAVRRFPVFPSSLNFRRYPQSGPGAMPRDRKHRLTVQLGTVQSVQEMIPARVPTSRDKHAEFASDLRITLHPIAFSAAIVVRLGTTCATGSRPIA